MKGFLRALNLLLVLGLICSPVLAEKNVKFMLSLSGNVAGPDVSYDYKYLTKDEWGEKVTLRSKMEKAVMFGGNLGAGLLFEEHGIEIYANFNYSMNRQKGSAFFELPSIIEWKNWAGDEMEQRFKIAKNEVEIGASYHFEGYSVQPYVGAGITIVNASIEMPETVVFRDEYHGYVKEYYSWWYGWYDYFYVEDHKISIKEVETTQEKLNAAGIHIKGGINFWIQKSVALFLGVKYTSVNAELPVQISAEGTKIVEIDRDGNIYWDTNDDRVFAGNQDRFNVAFGGISALFGLKFKF